MRTAAVVLAAGASSRLGQPKQLVRLGKETLLERAVRVAREAGCDPVVVVLGAESPRVLANSLLGDALPVIHDTWQEGMASSIRLGVRTLGFVAKDAEAVLLMTCDQPAVTADHLRALMSRHEKTASRYAGRSGTPALFPKSCFEELLSLSGDTGARALLMDACYVELLNGELDVDTMDDVAQMQELFGPAAP